MERANAEPANSQIGERFNNAIAQKHSGAGSGQASFVGGEKIHHARDERAARPSGASAIDEDPELFGRLRIREDCEHGVFPFGVRVRVDEQ
jgi:hypothetical protein